MALVLRSRRRRAAAALGPEDGVTARPGTLASLGSLAPPVDVEGPRVRLGLLWAGVTAAAVTTGPVLTSLVFTPVALAAAGQACRSWRRRPRRPHVAVAAGGAVLCAASAVAGPLAVGGAAALTVLAAVAVRLRRPGGVAWDLPLTVAIALLVGAGAAAPALIRGQMGATPALVFLALVHVVDASAFIVSSGTDSRWEGWVAGAASAAAVALGVAAVFVPPFRGLSPWVLAGVVAVLAPAGTMVATLVLGRRRAPAPALRRLDALVLTGPAWAVAAALLLDLG